MKRRQRSSLALLLLIMVIIQGCESSTFLNGKYIGEFPGEPVQILELRLHPNGTGEWVAEDEITPIKWESGREQILIHTNTGGNVPGKLLANAIEINVPGHGSIIFSKAKE